MPVYRAFIGTYTSSLPHVEAHATGIYVVSIDTDSRSIKILDGPVDAGVNPSYLTTVLTPYGKRWLFVANEGNTKEDSVTVMEVLDDLSMKKIAQVRGENMVSPAFVSTVGNGAELLVANYTSGNINVYSVNPASGMLTVNGFFQLEGRSMVVPDRQEGPHAHCIVPSPQEDLVLVADLGNDQVRIYRFGDDGKMQPYPNAGSNFIQTPPGSGPRHIRFHPEKPLVFIACELSNHVVVCCRKRPDGPKSGKDILEVIQAISTLPDDFQGTSYLADLRVSPDGNHLYVSNRYHDSIVHYNIGENGFLKRVGFYPSGGATPRNFNITPGGEAAIVAGQDNGKLVFFDILEDGSFQNRAVVEVPTPVCVEFLE